MKRFQEFMKEKIVSEDAAPQLWHASKAEIIGMWKNLRPVPLQIEPIPENQKGTRLQYDGIRITGSAQFINATLARLKDLLAAEDQPGVRLDLEYRQIESKDPSMPTAYLCYIHSETDTKKKAKDVNNIDTDSITPKTGKKIKTVLPD